MYAICSCLPCNRIRSQAEEDRRQQTQAEVDRELLQAVNRELEARVRARAGRIWV